MNRKMKDSGIAWIGEIPENWRLLKLKNILFERNEKNDPIKTNEILSLTIDKGVIPYKEKTGGGNKAKEDLTAYKLAYPNDIILNSMNIIAGSVGISKYFGCISPVYYALYSNNENYINYYNQLFQSTEFQRSLLGLGNGIMIKESSTGKLNTIRLRISLEKLKSIYLPVPCKEEQEKIASFLDKQTTLIDDLIEATKRSIEELKQYKQSVITETVTNGLDKNVKMKDSGIDWIGECPSHWDVNKINRLFEIKKDIANQNGHDVLSVTQKGLKVKDITKNEGQMAADYSKYQIVNKGDFVMNHMDLLTGWVDCSIYEGVTSPDYRVFKNRNYRVANNFYYKYVFQTCYTNKIFYGLGQGVSNLGRWRLQTDKFINFYLPIPPLEEQEAISQFLVAREIEINGIIEEKQKLISEFESYKKSMIYEYVTGKKEVL